MKEVSIIGADLVKQVFYLHGATSRGEAVFRKKLSHKHPWYIVATKALQPLTIGHARCPMTHARSSVPKASSSISSGAEAPCSACQTQRARRFCIGRSGQKPSGGPKSLDPAAGLGRHFILGSDVARQTAATAPPLPQRPYRTYRAWACRVLPVISLRPHSSAQI